MGAGWEKEWINITQNINFKYIHNKDRMLYFWRKKKQDRKTITRPQYIVRSTGNGTWYLWNRFVTIWALIFWPDPLKKLEVIFRTNITFLVNPLIFFFLLLRGCRVLYFVRVIKISFSIQSPFCLFFILHSVSF